MVSFVVARLKNKQCFQAMHMSKVRQVCTFCLKRLLHWTHLCRFFLCLQHMRIQEHSINNPLWQVVFVRNGKMAFRTWEVATGKCRETFTLRLHVPKNLQILFHLPSLPWGDLRPTAEIRKSSIRTEKVSAHNLTAAHQNEHHSLSFVITVNSATLGKTCFAILRTLSLVVMH